MQVTVVLLTVLASLALAAPQQGGYDYSAPQAGGVTGALSGTRQRQQTGGTGVTQQQGAPAQGPGFSQTTGFVQGGSADAFGTGAAQGPSGAVFIDSTSGGRGSSESFQGSPGSGQVGFDNSKLSGTTGGRPLAAASGAFGATSSGQGSGNRRFGLTGSQPNAFPSGSGDTSFGGFLGQGSGEIGVAGPQSQVAQYGGGSSGSLDQGAGIGGVGAQLGQASGGQGQGISIRGQGIGIQGQGAGIQGQGSRIQGQGAGIQEQETGIQGQAAGFFGQGVGSGEQGEFIGGGQSLEVGGFGAQGGVGLGSQTEQQFSGVRGQGSEVSGQGLQSGGFGGVQGEGAAAGTGIGVRGGQPPAPFVDDLAAPAEYNFKWDVTDPESGNFYGHEEERNGANTRGRYYVTLPDTRVMTVEYYADETGYHPTITYEGEAQVFETVRQQGREGAAAPTGLTTQGAVQTQFQGQGSTEGFRGQAEDFQRQTQAGEFQGQAGDFQGLAQAGVIQGQAADFQGLAQAGGFQGQGGDFQGQVQAGGFRGQAGDLQGQAQTGGFQGQGGNFQGQAPTGGFQVQGGDFLGQAQTGGLQGQGGDFLGQAHTGGSRGQAQAGGFQGQSGDFLGQAGGDFAGQEGAGGFQVLGQTGAGFQGQSPTSGFQGQGFTEANQGQGAGSGFQGQGAVSGLQGQGTFSGIQSQGATGTLQGQGFGFGTGSRETGGGGSQGPQQIGSLQSSGEFIDSGAGFPLTGISGEPFRAGSSAEVPSSGEITTFGSRTPSPRPVQPSPSSIRVPGLASVAATGYSAPANRDSGRPSLASTQTSAGTGAISQQNVGVPLPGIPSQATFQGLQESGLQPQQQFTGSAASQEQFGSFQPSVAQRQQSGVQTSQPSTSGLFTTQQQQPAFTATQQQGSALQSARQPQGQLPFGFQTNQQGPGSQDRTVQQPSQLYQAPNAQPGVNRLTQQAGVGQITQQQPQTLQNTGFSGEQTGSPFSQQQPGPFQQQQGVQSVASTAEQTEFPRQQQPNTFVQQQGIQNIGSSTEQSGEQFTQPGSFQQQQGLQIIGSSGELSTSQFAQQQLGPFPQQPILQNAQSAGQSTEPEYQEPTVQDFGNRNFQAGQGQGIQNQQTGEIGGVQSGFPATSGQRFQNQLVGGAGLQSSSGEVGSGVTRVPQRPSQLYGTPQG